MKLAGIKENEIIVSRSSAVALQQENSALRKQSKINFATLQKMNEEKENDDAFIRRALKKASNTKQQATQDIETAYLHVDELKQKYSQGTAEKYNELVGKHQLLARYCLQEQDQCNAIEREKRQLEENIPIKIKKAVDEAASTMKEENEAYPYG